jgi:hypothetical protein
MRLFRSLSRFFLLLALLSVRQLFATPFNVIPLTSIPDGANLYGLNDNDQIAGVFGNVAFIATTSTYDPQPLPDGLTLVSYATINNNGIVGGWGTADSSEEVFIGNTRIANPAGFTLGNAFAINDSNQMAGTVTANSIDYTGIIWSDSGGTTVAGTSTFLGINDAGLVVGTDINGQLVYGDSSAITTVTNPHDVSTMNGQGINSAGHIAATGFTASSTQAYFPAGGNHIADEPRPVERIPATGFTASSTQAYFYDGLAFTPIPLLDGFTDAILPFQSINDNDWVVGDLHGTFDSAFFWDPFNGTRLISDMVPAGWTIQFVTAINNHGDVLAFGTDGGYFGPIFLDYTPEPSTLLLGAISLLTLAIAWRRSAHPAAGSSRPQTAASYVAVLTERAPGGRNRTDGIGS